MIGFHIQDESVQRWDEAVARTPSLTWHKVVNNHSAARVAALKAQAAGKDIDFSFRQFQVNQHFPGLDWDFYKEQARDTISRFDNEDFRKNAWAIGAWETYNETIAQSQSAEFQARILMAELAACVVWNEEYRSRVPEYAHIRPAICSTAVGNDIPLGFARVAADHDAYMAYHPYIAVYYPSSDIFVTGLETAGLHRPSFREGVRPYQVSTALSAIQVSTPLSAIESVNEMVVGQPSPNEWLWASGRWTVMDERYRAAGYHIEWLFTEGGPVRDYTGKGLLDPMGGWRLCLEHDIEAYKATLDYWAANVQQWNERNGHRAHSVNLFTVFAGSQWKTFAHSTEEMLAIAEYANKWTMQEPGPGPEPEAFSITVYPVANTEPYVTSAFNAPRDYDKDGTFDDKHEGIDLRAVRPDQDVGGWVPSTIVAGQRGVIERIRRIDPGTGYGKYVRMRHDDFESGVRWRTWYAHLDSIAAGLNEGDYVDAGDRLGIAGSTGNSTAVHLHLTIQKTPGGLGGYVVADVVDPFPLIEALQDVEPPEPPSDDCVKAREPYVRVYVLLPPAAGKEWSVAVVNATWDAHRFTVGGSADDAGIGCGLKSKIVYAVNPAEWTGNEDDLIRWYEEHYPDAKIISIYATTPDELGQLLENMVLENI